MKVLHTADWHLNDIDHDEIEKCLGYTVAQARIESPDLIVIPGDITDSQNLKLDSRASRTMARIVSELADIAPVVIITGTPSHDGRCSEILRWAKGEHPIWVSERFEQIYLCHDGKFAFDPSLYEVKAVMTLLPTPTKAYLQDHHKLSIEASDQMIGEAMGSIIAGFGIQAKRIAPNSPHIIIGHFQVGGAFISETQQLIGRDIEVSKDQLASGNPTLVCLGHIHKAQKMGDNIFYSGSIYRKDFGEMESKGFFVHTLEPGLKQDGESPEWFIEKSVFIETPTKTLLKLEKDVTAVSIEDLDDTLLFHFKPEDIKGAHIKVVFTVWQDEANKINQAAVERFFLEAGAERAIVSLIRKPRETVRAANVIKFTSLRDKVGEMANLRQEKVSDEILDKADLLETYGPEQLVQRVGEVN